jgi:uncharacterized membrane protein
MLKMMVSKKILWLFLLLTGLLACLGSPAVLLAQEAKVDLSLSLFPDSYYKKIVPGQDNALYVQVRNNGTSAITNIRFSSDKPAGWIVEFKPVSLDSLGAGSSQTIDVNVIPDRHTGRGDYNLTILADAVETRAAVSTVLRIESGTSIWLWIGVAVGILVIAGFIIVYLRFGRQ